MVDIVTLFDMLWKILYILLSQSFDRYMWICKRDWQGTMFGYSKTRLLIIWIWMSISVMPGIIWANYEHLNDVSGELNIMRVVEARQVGTYKNYLLWTMLICPSAVLIALSGKITYNVVKVTKHSTHRSVHPKNILAIFTCGVALISRITIVGGLLYGISYQTECYKNNNIEATLLMGQGINFSGCMLNMMSFWTICQEYKNASKERLRNFRFWKWT